MDKDNERNGLQEIIDNVLDEMAREAGDSFDLSKVNLATFSARTGLSRSKARTLQTKNFKVTPHGRCGLKSKTTVLTGYTGVIDDLLRKGVTNSEVCFDRVSEQGYSGGLTTVKNYITAHANLVPAKRKLVSNQGSRGRRFYTEPGEAYQMDWGFVEVEDWKGRKYKLACFAMVCHHCGTCYIEFFPNARQENLFIGMVHAFAVMGVPEYVLTDNMKSVVIRRDVEGKPVWQADYAQLMACVGFNTKLCKPCECQALFPSYGKDFFFLFGKKIIPPYGKHFFPAVGKVFFSLAVSTFSLADASKPHLGNLPNAASITLLNVWLALMHRSVELRMFQAI